MEQRLDPFDVLVSLGVIRRSEIEAADRVESASSTTMLSRLIAVGVEADVLLQALSRLTNIPIATPAMLAGAGPIALPQRFVPVMRQLLAAPVGRVDEGILQVVVADPRACRKLNAAGIAHRPFLALEPDVVQALQAVWPGGGAGGGDDDGGGAGLASLTEPTLRNLPVSPRPITATGDVDDHSSSAPRPVSVLDGEIVRGVDDPDGYVPIAALNAVGTDVDLDSFVTVPSPISIPSSSQSSGGATLPSPTLPRSSLAPLPPPPAPLTATSALSPGAASPGGASASPGGASGAAPSGAETEPADAAAPALHAGAGNGASVVDDATAPPAGLALVDDVESIDVLARLDDESASAVSLSRARAGADVDPAAPVADGAAAPAEISFPGAAAAVESPAHSNAEAAVAAAMAFDETTDRIAARRRAAAAAAAMGTSSAPPDTAPLLARVRAAGALLLPLTARARAALAAFLETPQRRAVAGAAVVAAVVVVVVAAVAAGDGASEPVEDEQARQAWLVDQARALAAHGEHAWAFAHCTDALAIDPTSTAGKEAAIVCAEEGALLGERDHVAELERLVDTLAPDDPVRADAVLALERLDALYACDACADDDGAVEETRARVKNGAAPTPPPKWKPKKKKRPRRPR